MAATERLLHSVGKQTFVKCFEFFRENYNKLNRYEMAKIMPTYNPMLQTNNGDSTVPRIASFAIQIFKENKEIEALEICAKAINIPDDVIEEAKSLLIKYKHKGQPLWSPHECALLLEYTQLVLAGKINRMDAIHELSGKLRQVAIGNGDVIDEKYRNVGGVSLQMSCMEYLLTDGSQGMNKAGNNFKRIVQIYQENPDVFKAILNKERADLNNVINQDMVQLKGVERKQKKLHFVYEGRLSTSDIKKIKASRGYKCEACDMTFKGRYPGLDDEFIECHHKIPYSYLREHEERSMKPSDFLILCPNCHAMIHRLDDPGDLDMLKEILKEGEK